MQENAQRNRMRRQFRSSWQLADLKSSELLESALTTKEASEESERSILAYGVRSIDENISRLDGIRLIFGTIALLRMAPA